MMDFKIESHLSVCRIFGGEFKNSQIAVDLQLNGDYSLIEASLSSQNPNQPALDLFSVLNEAFHLSLPTNFLLVQDAGFFTYSYQGKGTGKPLTSNFSHTGLPDVVAEQAQPEVDTASFWFELIFASNPLFDTLLEISAEPGSNTLSFQAVLQNQTASGKPMPASSAMTTAQYYVSLPDFKLLDLFEFSNITLYFQFAQDANQYQIQGQLALEVFGQAFEFVGRVKSTETLLNGCVAISNQSTHQSIDNPFGGMPGIVIDHLIFAIQHTYANHSTKSNSVFRIQGKVSFDKKIEVMGQLYLVDNTPVMASVLIGGSLDMGALFEQCLHGLHWPETFINIVFEDNSRLYYLKDGATPPTDTSRTIVCNLDDPQPSDSTDPADISYQAGFNAFSFFTLTLLIDIPLAGNVNITPNQGVTASIQLQNAIELWVLSISAPHSSTDTAAHGPIFNFNSQKSEMGFQCGLEFFQDDFGLDVSVNASKGQKNNELFIQGTLATPQAIPPFLPADASMTFSYSRSQGFRIDDWPAFMLDDVQQYINFFEELKKVANSSNNGCGKIAEFVNKEAFTAKFKLKPTFETTPSKPGGEKDTLYFVVGGEISLFCVKTQFASFPSPVTFKIQLDPSFTFASLLSALWDAIKDAAQQLIEALMDDGEAISGFLTYFAGKQAVSYAASLACKGRSGGDVVSATEAGSSAFSAAGGIAGGAAAIGAGITAIGGIFSSSCFVAGTQVRRASGETVAIEQIQVGDLLLGANHTQNRVVALDQPKLGNRRLYCFNDGHPFVTSEHPFLTQTGWKAIDPQATLRENSTLEVDTLSTGDRLTRYQNQPLLITQLTPCPADSDTQLYNFYLEPGHSYIANDFIVHNKGGDHGHGTDNPPDKVTSVTLTYASEQLTVTWSPSSGAQQYIATLTMPTGESKHSGTLSYSTYSHHFALLPSSPAGRYLVTVTAQNPYGKTESSPTSILKLAPPAPQFALKQTPTTSGVDPALLADPVLTIRWPQVDSATDYQLYLDGSLSTHWQASAGAEQSHQFTFTQSQTSGAYTFALTASAEACISSSPCAPQVWVRLDTPENFSAQTGSDGVTFNWQTVSADTDYLIQILQGSQSVYATRVPAEQHQITIPLQDLPTQATLTARVRSLATSGNNAQTVPSLWSAPVGFNTQNSPVQIATSCHEKGDSASVCAQAIHQAYPALDVEAMISAMQQGGYPASETATGIVSVFNNISANVLGKDLLHSYPPLPTPTAIAHQAKQQGQSGPECAKALLESYPTLSAHQVASAMAAAGFSPEDLAQASLLQNPTLSATNLATLLVGVFRRSELSS